MTTTYKIWIEKENEVRHLTTTSGGKEEIDRIFEMLQAFAPTVHPAQCPDCGASDFDGAQVDIAGVHATQHCGCNACGCEWVDTYLLIRQVAL